ncbi:MAG: HTTM domain-containing protein [Niastella sp.]|nr:HTTM domain-containing protein [Niastella sp.]PZR02619.1 MAG: hypothetical protein DI539_27465 [Flavobacterium psychrophilum]
MRTSTLYKKAYSFFNDPVSPAPLAIFRILIAAFTLLQAILWYNDWLAFMGADGWIQWEISEILISDLTLHMAKVYKFFSFLPVTQDEFVMGFFWVYVISAFLLLIGLFTKVFSFLTFLCHYILMCTIEVYVYGVDIFLQIALFYIMLMPVARMYSLDAWWKRVPTTPSWEVTLSLRVLQIHMGLIYLSAGFEKLISPEWWGGNVIWRSLVQPDFRQYDFTWLADKSWLFITLSWFTIIIETGYIIFIWIPKVRVFWLAAIIALHVGICVFLGLWLFGLIMILLSVSAFGTDAWKDIQSFTRNRQRKINIQYSPA